MTTQKVVMINGAFKNLERTSKKGKVSHRTRIDVESEPLAFIYDEGSIARDIAKGVKQTIVQLMETRTRGRKVKPATEASRRRQLKAYNAGKNWAKKRYEGGRTKHTPPRTKNIDRPWLFSGRFIKGLSVRRNPKEGTAAINMVANRMSRATATPAELNRMYQSLRELVPEIERPDSLARHPHMAKALNKALNDMVMKATTRNADLRQMQRDLAKRIGLDVIGLFRL